MNKRLVGDGWSEKHDPKREVVILPLSASSDEKCGHPMIGPHREAYHFADETLGVRLLCALYFTSEIAKPTAVSYTNFHTQSGSGSIYTSFVGAPKMSGLGRGKRRLGRGKSLSPKRPEQDP